MDPLSSGQYMAEHESTTNLENHTTNDSIKFHFLGGADEVGNVGCLIEDDTGTRILVDYGLAPTKPPRYPTPSPPVNDVLLTHAHIDHIGMTPWLAGTYDSSLHGTKLTADVSEIMWSDTYKISDIEGYPLGWDKRDMEMALESWIPHEFREWFEIGDWNCRLHRAGHIPGAAMIEILTPQKRILWTGDIDTRNSPNVQGAKPIKCDILCMEGTYGGRNHRPRKEEEERFVKRVLHVVSRGGIALIPAFASGRGQDILRILHKHTPQLEVHYDGMGTRVTRHWMNNPQFINRPKELEKAFRWSKRVSGKSDRKKALNGDVIVTTSGMLDGGPAIWYLNRLRHDQSNAILLTGYQAEGSGGRKLIEERHIDIFGKRTHIPLEYDKYDLSNHADHNSLVQFAKECEPSDIILFHADPEASKEISEAIPKEIRVHRTTNNDPIIIPYDQN